MKTHYLSFLVCTAFLAMPFSLWAQFYYNAHSEITTTYNYCNRDVELKFLVLQTQGEDDYLTDILVEDKTNNADNVILEFRRVDTVPPSPEWVPFSILKSNHPNMSFGPSSYTWYFKNYFGSGFEYYAPEYEVETVNGFHKFYVKFTISILPLSIQSGQTFLADFTGHWEANGGGGDVDFTDLRKTTPLTRPNAPIGLTASTDECGFIQLNWSNNQTVSCPNAGGIQVSRNDQTINANLLSGQSFTDNSSSLVPGETYEYKVRFLNSSSENISEWSAVAEGNTFALPEPITDFEVVSISCNGDVRVNWVKGSTYTKQYIKLDANTAIELNGNTSTYTLNIGTGTTPHTITLFGEDKCGEVTSTATIIGIQTPQPPGVFAFTANSIVEEPPGLNKLTWGISSDAVEYDIFRIEAGVQTKIATVSNNTYSDDGASTCTSYKYQVIAKNDCGNRESPKVDAADLQPGNVVLDQTGLLCSKGYFPDRVELDWVRPDDLSFDHYKIFRKKLGSTADSTQIGTADKNAVHYVDDYAQAGTLYRYYVSSTSDCNGVESNSNAISDIGFRLPIASVSGNVHFENGQAVEDVQVTVDRVEGNIGRAMRFDGSGYLDINSNYGDGNELDRADSMTVEFWMNQLATGEYELFSRKRNGREYGLRYKEGSGFTAFHNQGGNQAYLFEYLYLDTLPYFHVAFVKTNSNILLFINGKEIASTSTAYPTNISGTRFKIGEGFQGLIDEFRVYSGRSKSQSEIEYDMPRILTGDQSGMVAYWGFNEGVGTGVYDISHVENYEFNGNHLSINGDAVWDDTNIPTSGQLGHRAYTDEAGNYIVTNIRYTGNGNTFNVVPFYSPQGTPHDFEPTSTILFLGEGAVVQSGVDFVDKSSFNVRLRSFYALNGDTCENKTLRIYVDEGLALQSNGQLVEHNGINYEFQVPIGRHKIRVEQAGHIFENEGYWPGPDSSYDFQADLDGTISLEDLTRIRVAGRIVGGTVEANKGLLYHKSKNNIGMANITFTSENGCHNPPDIRTDSLSGEYVVDLLPFRYIQEISMINSGPQTVDVNNSFGNLNIFDITAVPDTLWAIFYNVNPAGDTLNADSSFYLYKRNYVYRSDPALDVTSAGNNGPLTGEDELVIETQNGSDIIVPLDQLNFPVFFAASAYRTKISAFEEYFNYDALDTILVDRVGINDGTLRINNGLGNAAGIGADYQENIELTNGEALYTFIGSIPDISGRSIMPGQIDSSFVKAFDVSLSTADGNTDWVYYGYVFGGLAIPGSSFITEGPETVDYILRDPPGDGSFAFFKEESSISKSQSWFNTTGGTVGLNSKIQLGAEFGTSAGTGVSFSFNTKVIGGIENELEVGGSFDTRGNYVETTSFSTTIATSDMDNLTGGATDLFIGKSYNFLFGASNEVSMIDTSLCSLTGADCVDGTEIEVGGKIYKLGKRKALFLVPDGFASNFYYSQFFIEKTLIPQLKDFRNELISDDLKYPEYAKSVVPESSPAFGLNNDDRRLVEYGFNFIDSDSLTTEAVDYSGDSYIYTPANPNKPDDRVRWYNQQIRLWEGALGQNEKLKIDAKQRQNISFTGGTTFSYDHVSVILDETAESYEVSLNAATTIFTEAIVAGNGLETSATIAITSVGGETQAESEMTVNAYGYTLSDKNTGDFMSIDVKDDGAGNGPVFSLRGGETMCPWEQGEVSKYYNPGTPLGESTVPREAPALAVAPPTNAINVPEHQPARWTLRMSNNSETGDIQWYGLRVIDQTHPADVSFSINGLGPNRVFEIPAGQTIERVLEMKKGAANSYSGIQLVLYSTCEYDAYQNDGELFNADTITIGAEFIETCSPVEISLPKDPWVRNTNDGNVYEILATGFSQSYQGFENIQLQYKPTFSADWRGIETFWKGQVPIGQTGEVLGNNVTQKAYSWDVSQIADGPYEIRAVSTCLLREYESPSVKGIIDRIRPHAFGNPQPADGVLDPNDDILLSMNETIDPTAVSINNFSIRGVLNGSVLRHNTAIQLDGVNDHVAPSIGTRLGNAPFTIEMWVRPTAKKQSILWSQGEDADSSIVIGTNSQNRLYLQYDDVTLMSDVRIDSLQKWYHLAITCSETGVVSFFQTGILKTTSQLDSLPPIPGPMVIGKKSWENGNSFAGYIHEFRIWRTEQTLGQLQTNMLKMLTGNELGLSILWPMDEGQGNQIRDIVRKKNATLFGDWAILPSGRALHFNGASKEYIEVVPDDGLVFTRQHDFSIEFWLKAAPGSSRMTVLSNGKGDGTDGLESGWALTLTPNGTLEITHGSTSAMVIEDSLRDNNWHHVTIVMNRLGNLNTYLDGRLRKSLYGQNFGEFAGPKLYVGARGWPGPGTDSTDQYYTGDLDDLRIWNTARTKAQIEVDMQHRLLGNEPGLNFYLPFETYSNLNGIELLAANIADESSSDLMTTPVGSPNHIEQDPNIKLPRPVVDIAFSYSLNNDKIILTLLEDPVRVENVVLSIAAFGLRDLRGNEMAGPITWTAYVNQNQLHWKESELSFEKPEKEPLYFDVEIENSGGIELSYEILNLPEWLTAMPSDGSIGPVSTKTIQFAIADYVNIGDYSIDINLLSGQGFNDKLIVDLHVFGVPPVWDIDPADYEYTMTIIADLDIHGELSDDPLDQVAAFIDGEVRGKTTMEYVEEFDSYLAFLTVYSNDPAGDLISFRAWDASRGFTYPGVGLQQNGNVQLNFTFDEEEVVGSPAQPARFIINNDLIQQIPINAGWTWISFNVEAAAHLLGDLDLFFEELVLVDDDKVVGQTKNGNTEEAKYGANKFTGSLHSLSIDEMYKCRFTNADILQVFGELVDPDAYPIEVDKDRWNWIPFLSPHRVELNEALADFDEVTDGDQIKSQDQFAVYDGVQQKWIGTLKAMEPGKGYMLYAQKNGDVIYPQRAVLPTPTRHEATLEQMWNEVKWTKRQSRTIPAEKYNMTIVANLADVPSQEDVLIAAMVDGQVIDLSLTDGSMSHHFMTLQSDGNPKLISFDIYDRDGNFLGTPVEEISWSKNEQIGSLEQPFVLHLEEETELTPSEHVYPNPFHDQLTIVVDAEDQGFAYVRLMDMQGRLIANDKFAIGGPGHHDFVWNVLQKTGKALVSGAYMLEVQAPGITQQTLVVRQ